MHAFDFFYPKRLSSSERWVDSIYKDTCTPDDQSLKNPVEVCGTALEAEV